MEWKWKFWSPPTFKCSFKTNGENEGAKDFERPLPALTNNHIHLFSFMSEKVLGQKLGSHSWSWKKTADTLMKPPQYFQEISVLSLCNYYHKNLDYF